MTTAHLLYPTVVTYRRISARHDLRPRVVPVANENPQLSCGQDRHGGKRPQPPTAPVSVASFQSARGCCEPCRAAEPIGSPDGLRAAACDPAALTSLAFQSSFHSTGDTCA